MHYNVEAPKREWLPLWRRICVFLYISVRVQVCKTTLLDFQAEAPLEGAFSGFSRGGGATEVAKYSHTIVALTHTQTQRRGRTQRNTNTYSTSKGISADFLWEKKMLNTARRYKMICQSPPWWLFCVWNVATVGIRRNCCGFPKERRRGHQICFDAHRWCSQGWQEGDADVAVAIVESLSASKIRHGYEVQIIMLISCTYSCFKVANVVRGNLREKTIVFFLLSEFSLWNFWTFFLPSLPKGILSIWSRLCLGTKYLGHWWRICHHMLILKRLHH